LSLNPLDNIYRFRSAPPMPMSRSHMIITTIGLFFLSVESIVLEIAALATDQYVPSSEAYFQ